MKHSRARLKQIFLVGVSCVIAFTVTVSNSVHAGEKASRQRDLDSRVRWSSKMDELYRLLVEVLTDASSDSRYNDPANRSRILRNAKRLATLSHEIDLKSEQAPVDLDPTVHYISKNLHQESQRAVRELQRNNRAYARSVLRSIPSYCITCHTRNATGPQIVKLALEPTSDILNPFERGEFFAASRQFDRAMEEYKKVIEDPKGPRANMRQWESAIRQSLLIAVRVKKDPQAAQMVAEAVIKAPESPSFMKDDAKVWLTAIGDWQEEQAPKRFSQEDIYQEANRLIVKARQTQLYSLDRTADIYYLRASALTHDLLQQAPQGSRAAEALLLAGITYEALGVPKPGDLHEVFYEACIHREPHSGVAERCYRRLETNVFFGYSGSSGTNLPDDVRDRLLRLRSLAGPELKTTK